MAGTPVLLAHTPVWLRFHVFLKNVVIFPANEKGQERQREGKVTGLSRSEEEKRKGEEERRGKEGRKREERREEREGERRGQERKERRGENRREKERRGQGRG